MDLALLPDADASLPCAVHTRSLAIDPGGTAIRADVLIAVEVPLPWPKPVFDHPLLRHIGDVIGDLPTPIRLLSAVPRRHDGSLEVVGYRRGSVGAIRATGFTDESGIPDAVASVVGRLAEPGDVAGTTHGSPELWLCTQGSHDRCCGSDGTRLATELGLTRPDLTVRRVSHIGGHRFAPTAISLPDGRMWGYLDPAGVDAIADRSGDLSLLADRCRGWWGADVGPAQVAERAVFTAVGWTWDGFDRRVEQVAGTVDDVDTTMRVWGIDALGTIMEFDVVVGVSRAVPTIACGVPGGLPAKPALEYVVRELRQLAGPATGE